MKKLEKDDIDHFMSSNVYLPTRTVYMGSMGEDEYGESGTDFQMAANLWKAIHILDNQGPRGESPITVIMNNPGGCEYHGMSIFDAIKHCANHVTVKVYGFAMSMGSIIIHAADDRLMSENSKMMLHYGTANVGSDQHAQDTYVTVEEAKKFDKFMENLYLEKIKEVRKDYDLRRLRDMIKFDRYISAEEALYFNLIDGIIIGHDKVKRELTPAEKATITKQLKEKEEAWGK